MWASGANNADAVWASDANNADAFGPISGRKLKAHQKMHLKRKKKCSETKRGFYG